MYTKQETFEISCLGVIAQDHPGWDDERELCSYAFGCAVAQLLPREIWSSLPSSACTTHNDIAGPLRKAGHSVLFADELQACHDRVVGTFAVQGRDAWRRDWLNEVRLLAKDEGLDFRPVEAAARATGWEV
jgi:hypothetical protein